VTAKKMNTLQILLKAAMMHYIIRTILYNTLIKKQKKKGTCLALHNHSECSPFPLNGQFLIPSSGYTTVDDVAIPTVQENPPSKRFSC
jgi:hypothetical protein